MLNWKNKNEEIVKFVKLTGEIVRIKKITKKTGQSEKMAKNLVGIEIQIIFSI